MQYAFRIVCLTLLIGCLPHSAYADIPQQNAEPTVQHEDIPINRSELVSTEKRREATITKIIEEKEVIQFGTAQLYQKLEVQIVDSSGNSAKLVIENGGILTASTPRYAVGDRVIVSEITQPDGTSQRFIVDYVRRDSLALLFVAFVVVAIAVAGRKGIAALLGMGYSFGIIFAYVLPNIAAGHNPIIIALTGGTLIVPVTFYLSHGWNKKTHAAVISTVVSLGITGIIAHYAIDATQLTGFSSEDASFLQLMSEGTIHIKGLLLAGIIVGLFGILDDITVSQAAIVYALKDSNPQLSTTELYRRSMHVGRDHIGSLVNTIILVYTGAALPFLLLLQTNHQEILTTLNYEIIAEEIVRTLTASIGLILAVPITTFIAAYYDSIAQQIRKRLM